MRLILASGSPRRKEILEDLGYNFTIRTAGFDESAVSLERPAEGVQALALGKANAAAEDTFVAEKTVFVGSDTVVVLDDAVMGKPADEDEAFAMLRALSGRTHVVCTGVAIVEKDEKNEVVENETFVEQTEVTFFDLSDEEIRAYIATKEPMDKAGAYGIQGQGCLLVEGIRGDYLTVVGLPAARLSRRLKARGIVPNV